MFEPLEFFKFLQNPQYLSIERKKTNVLFTSIKIYLVLLLFVGLINSLNIIILGTFLTLPHDKAIDIPNNLKDHICIYFFIVAMFAPFMEEIIFRLSLIFEPANLALSLSSLTALIIHKVSSGFITIAAFIFCYSIVYWVAYKFRMSSTKFWEKNFKYFFYSLSIIFALVHISNYKIIEYHQYLIVPILVFPQLAMGFILSFVRVFFEKGFLISIFVHIMINAVTVSVFLFQYSK